MILHSKVVVKKHKNRLEHHEDHTTGDFGTLTSSIEGPVVRPMVSPQHNKAPSPPNTSQDALHTTLCFSQQTPHTEL